MSMSMSTGGSNQGARESGWRAHLMVWSYPPVIKITLPRPILASALGFLLSASPLLRVPRRTPAPPRLPLANSTTPHAFFSTVSLLPQSAFSRPNQFRRNPARRRSRTGHFRDPL